MKKTSTLLSFIPLLILAIIMNCTTLNAAEIAAPHHFPYEYRRLVAAAERADERADERANEDLIQRMIVLVGLPINTPYSRDNISIAAMNLRMGLHGLNRQEARLEVLSILNECLPPAGQQAPLLDLALPLR
jgi:hypothetical protein